MSISDELQKLEEMRRGGTLTDEEFARAKAAVIAGTVPPIPAAGAQPPEALALAKEHQTRQWAVLLHLSLLAGHLLPLAGFIVPIVIWQMKKDELPGLDPHGKMVTNWIISEIIYGIVFGLMILLLVGIPLLIALVVVGVVFPIIGAIKANDGIVWKYPFTMPILK